MCNGGTLDLPDDKAARQEAALEASELRNYPGEGDRSKWSVRVTNETGRLVASVLVGGLGNVRRRNSGT